MTDIFEITKQFTFEAAHFFPNMPKGHIYRKIHGHSFVVEVTFYGNDPMRGSFREIKENSILFSDEFDIKNKLPFDSVENVEINFLFWVDGLSIEKLIKLPHDYHDQKVRYDQESVEVTEVTKV